MRRCYLLVPVFFFILVFTPLFSRAAGTGPRTAAYDFKGADFTEMMASSAPSVVTNAATLVTDNGATLNATVNPNSIATNGEFQYGLTIAYGSTTTQTAVGSDGNNHNLSAGITGLLPATVYHFRATATNTDGTTNGNDLTFTTAGHPFVTTNAATSITDTSADLNATVTPNLHLTTASFEFGTDTTYGILLDTISVGSDQTGHAESFTLTGLTQGTTYHYRIKSTNLDGIVHGLDQTFTTLQPPNASTSGVDSVTGTSAFLEGSVNPLSSATTAMFAYGLTQSYGTTTASINVGSDANAHNVGKTISGLTPGTAYHFQVVATSAGGIDSGGDNIFTTIGLPTAGSITVYNVTGSSADFSLSGTTGGATSTMVFQWVTDSTQFTAASTNVDSEQYYGDGAVEGKTGTLKPNTTYFVRAKALNIAGAAFSPIAVFATLASSNEYYADSATVGLYHFDGRNGSSVEDYSFYHRNGTATAPDSLGKYGTGKYFNLSSDYVSIPDANSDFAVANGDFTVETWIFPSLSTSGAWTFISKGQFSNDNAAYQLAINHGKFDFSISAGGTAWDYSVESVDSVIESDEWQHVAVTVSYASKVVTLYVNGHSVPYSVLTGPFPSHGQLASNAPVLFGVASATSAELRKYARSQSPGPGASFGYLDEVRFSSIARDSTEFTQALGPTVTGYVYNDKNDNGRHQTTEVGVSGWKVYLLDPSLHPIDSTYSNSNGQYAFRGLDAGLSYFVSEADSSSSYWIETYPDGNLFYADFSGSNYISGDNFEDYLPCAWIGGATGCPTLATNWSCGHAPTSLQGVRVHGHVTFTCPLPDSILSIDVDSGSTATFTGQDSLHVTGPFNIHAGGGLYFDSTDTHPTIFLESNFSNYGTFDPGASTFIFDGTSSQSIGLSSTLAPGYDDGVSAGVAAHSFPAQVLQHHGSGLTKGARSITNLGGIGGRSGKRTDGVGGSTFYNLTVAGADVSTSGNLLVENQLEVDSALSVGTADTVIVSSNSSGAISGSGKINRGTIQRAIDPASGSNYRFESDASYLAFTGGTHPTSVTETSLTDTLPRSYNELYWVEVPCTVDTNAKRVEADGLHHLSRWVVGKPSGGSGRPFRKSTQLPDSLLHVNGVARVYGVTPNSEGSFTANASFSYVDSEEIGLHVDNTYSLFRGPYAFDSVVKNWNIVSLPVSPEDNLVADLFPTANAGAFDYNGNTGYHIESSMTPGMGYWLKFPASTDVALLGTDDTSITYDLQAGWNMIGTISYPANVSDVVTSPEGQVSSQFFGYLNGYTAASTLRPLRGYWVKVASTCQLTVTAAPSGNAAAKTAADPFKNLSSLIITDAEGSTQTLYFGADNSIKASMFEMPPAPPKGIMDARFTDNRLVEIAPRAGSSSFDFSLTSAVYPVKIEWITPKYISGVLKVADHEYAMNENGSAYLNAGEPASLLLQKDGTVTVPKKFALYQNYPNPFNPTTNIKFDLPKDAVVTLKVYNVLGQEVASLADRQSYKAGSYSLKFNSSALSSGVYFYSITAGEYKSVKKMMSIK